MSGTPTAASLVVVCGAPTLASTHAISIARASGDKHQTSAVHTIARVSARAMP
jgi:hypothetical protein